MDKKYERFIAELYLQHAAALLQRAYRVTGDRERAQELLQETFLIALLKAGSLYQHTCPEGWLQKTMRNLLRQEQRRAARTPQALEDDIPAMAWVGKGQGLLDLLPAQLSEEEKIILCWRFEQEMSYEEIANRLGVTQAAAGMRLQRAKRHCRELLEKEKNIF